MNSGDGSRGALNIRKPAFATSRRNPSPSANTLLTCLAATERPRGQPVFTVGDSRTRYAKLPNLIRARRCQIVGSKAIVTENNPNVLRLYFIIHESHVVIVYNRRELEFCFTWLLGPVEIVLLVLRTPPEPTRHRRPHDLTQQHSVTSLARPISLHCCVHEPLPSCAIRPLSGCVPGGTDLKHFDA